MAGTHHIIADNANITKAIADLVKNSKDYKPFTAKEERQFIKDNIDNPEYLKSELIKRNVRLVLSMGKKYALTTDSFDDLIQSGFYGLAKAAEKFDYVNAKNRFCTYAGFWIRKYLLNPYYDRYESKIKYNAISLDKPIGAKDGEEDNNTISMLDSKFCPCYNRAIPDINTEISNSDKISLVNSISENVATSGELSGVDKQVYSMCMLQHKTIKDTSKIINIPSKDVEKSKKKVTLYIRKMLSTKYNIQRYSDI